MDAGAARVGDADVDDELLAAFGPGEEQEVRIGATDAASRLGMTLENVLEATVRWTPGQRARRPRGAEQPADQRSRSCTKSTRRAPPPPLACGQSAVVIGVPCGGNARCCRALPCAADRGAASRGALVIVVGTESTTGML